MALEPSGAVPSCLCDHLLCARPADPMSCRPFLLNQHFQHIKSVSFSFLLSEKSCRHELIFKETYFHLSSPLRSPGLLHPPGHSQIPSCAPIQHHPMVAPTRTSPLPHTQLPSQGADPCMEGADVQQCPMVLPLGSVPPAPPPWHPP